MAGGAGTVTASGGTLHLTGTVASGPTLAIADVAGSVLSIENTAIAAAPVTIDTSNKTLNIGSSGNLTINGGAESITNGTIKIATGGQLSDSSGFTIGSSALLFGSGKVTGAISGTGIVEARGGTITLSDGAVLNLTNLSSTAWFANTVGDGASGTDVFVSDTVCFCRGTLILTERGEVAVEDLKIGDRVKTLSGSFKPIVWIGFGRDLVTRANRLARPVIVRQSALADNVPRRDLYLTHGHALYLDGVLIPVEPLVNHRSIRWDDTARVVEYYHIEIEDHDVLFAEGAPAESYYDAKNRALFQNTREGSEAGAARPIFAPVLNAGEVVEKVWAELFERAGGQIERETTDEPDLHLVIAGERFDPASLAGGVYTFAVAGPPAGTLLLSSRSAVPSLLGLSRHDHRRLGVAIRQIILYRPGVMTCFDHDAPLFREGGCHLPEGGHCWTDGELYLPASLFAHLTGAFRIVVHTKRHFMRYSLSAPVAAMEPRHARGNLRIVSGRH